MAVVGYWYSLGFHAGICHGPVDAVTRITCDDREVWSGRVESNSTLTILKGDLFGGERKEGGLIGLLDVEFGGPTQQPNAYLAEQLGAATGGAIPAFRGILGLVWRGSGSFDGVQLPGGSFGGIIERLFRVGRVSANNPYIKPLAVRVERILAGWGADGPWLPNLATITMDGGIKAMNPAHILYQCLTNIEWGMGYPRSAIGASFNAAATKLHAEGFGLCMLWNQADTIEAFCKIVCDHIGAALNVDPRTGLFELKLIRDDYTPSELPLFGPADIVSVSGFQRPGLGELVNEVTVRYQDGQRDKASTVTIQDLAGVRSQGGAIIAKTVTYAGAPTESLAQRLAARDLLAMVTPIARMQIRGKRQLRAIRPGDPFRVSWPALGLVDVVLRAVKVAGGTLDKGEVTIDALEDVFGMPASTYAGSQPPQWVDPLQPPAPSPDAAVLEVPFFELQRSMGLQAAQALPADAGYLGAVASKPSSVAFDFGIAIRQPNGTDAESPTRGQFSPAASLSSGINAGATAVQITSRRDAYRIRTGAYAIIGGVEVVRVDAINTATWTLTIGRGVLDTVPRAHAQGTRIVFADGNVAADTVQRIDGALVRAKILPRTGLGQLATADAQYLDLTMDQRAARPYPPGRLRIAGQTYPATTVDVAPVITWSHRNRLQQNLEGDESGNIGPEPGTGYRARLVNVTTGQVVAQTDGAIFGTSWAVSPTPVGDFAFRVEVWSTRGGLESWQRASHAWAYTFYLRLTTEAGDRLLTESGDIINGG